MSSDVSIPSYAQTSQSDDVYISLSAVSDHFGRKNLLYRTFVAGIL